MGHIVKRNRFMCGPRGVGDSGSEPHLEIPHTLYLLNCWSDLNKVQFSPFITLCLESLGMDHVICELSYEGQFH